MPSVLASRRRKKFRAQNEGSSTRRRSSRSFVPTQKPNRSSSSNSAILTQRAPPVLTSDNICIYSPCLHHGAASLSSYGSTGIRPSAASLLETINKQRGEKRNQREALKTADDEGQRRQALIGSNDMLQQEQANQFQIQNSDLKRNRSLARTRMISKSFANPNTKTFSIVVN